MAQHATEETAVAHGNYSNVVTEWRHILAIGQRLHNDSNHLLAMTQFIGNNQRRISLVSSDSLAQMLT